MPLKNKNIYLILILGIIFFFSANNVQSATCVANCSPCTSTPGTWTACPGTGRLCGTCGSMSGCVWWGTHINCGWGDYCCSCPCGGNLQCWGFPQIGCTGGGPGPLPCGDCIPSGCGFTALPLEKKFVIDNKTSDEIQQMFLRSVQFDRLTIAVENSSGIPERKSFLASIFEPSLKTIRNFLSRIFFYRS